MVDESDCSEDEIFLKGAPEDLGSEMEMTEGFDIDIEASINDMSENLLAPFELNQTDVGR